MDKREKFLTFLSEGKVAFDFNAATKTPFLTVSNNLTFFKYIP